MTTQTDTRLQRRRNASRYSDTIDSMIGNLEYLRNDLVNARTILEDQHRTYDGWPPGSDAPKVSGGQPSSSVEASVCGNGDTDDDGARARVEAQLRGLDDELNAAALTIKNLRDECVRYIRRHAGQKPEDENKEMRCKGTGDADGATCTNIASHHRSDNRCVKCGPAHDADQRTKDAERKRLRRLRVAGHDLSIEAS